VPKLLDGTVTKNKQKIERAALRLFTRQGFHGTTVREIAKAAAVSMGKLYLYYPTKEDIFIDLVHQMDKKMEVQRQKELLPLMQSPDPDSLRKLGLAVGRVVSENLDYWNYATALFQKTPIPFPRNVNPGFAYANLYLQFVTYFLVEELFGAKRHMGVSDEEAIDQMVRLYTGDGTIEGQRAKVQRG